LLFGAYASSTTVVPASAFPPDNSAEDLQIFRSPIPELFPPPRAAFPKFQKIGITTPGL